MPTQKVNSIARTGKREKQTDSIGRAGKRSGNRINGKDSFIKYKPRKVYAPIFLDTISNVSHDFKEKKNVLPANWFLIFLSMFKLGIGVMSQKKKIFNILKMFIDIPGFEIRNSDTLLDVARNGYGYMKKGYRYIAQNEEIALVSESFDSEQPLIEFCFDDVNRIKDDDPKLHYALLLLYRYCISEKQFGSSQMEQNEWHLEMMIEELLDNNSVSDLETDESLCQNYLDKLELYRMYKKICENTSLKNRRERILLSLVKSGFFDAYGLTKSIKDIMGNDAEHNPYTSVWDDSKYVINGEFERETEQEGDATNFYELFFISKTPIDFGSDWVISSINDRMGNYGSVIYYNVYGQNSRFQSNSMQKLYLAFNTIEKFVINHDTYKKYHCIH